MAVEIDHCRHHRLAGQVNARRSCWDLHLDRRPTRANAPSVTVNMESSMGALPSPVMRRAPSKTVERLRGWRLFSRRRAGWRDDSRHDDQTSDVSDGFHDGVHTTPVESRLGLESV